MDTETRETPVVGHPPIAAVSVRPIAPQPRPGAVRDVVVLGVVGVVLLAALAAGAASLYREFYSPSAFVERYLGLLAEGRATDALALPGVSVDSTVLSAAGLPVSASDALLRGSVLGGLDDLEVVAETTVADVVDVTVAFGAGGYAGEMTLQVESDGWVGGLPRWRFAASPLAVVQLTLSGSTSFEVNGFAVDRRQVSPDGALANAADALPLLVFSPGLYSISVDTDISETPGAAVLSDSPLAPIPVQVRAEPTPQFLEVVQQKVGEYLDSCATQRVLQPTGCPFGFAVRERVEGLPTWSIAQQPTVRVQPDGDGWVIPEAPAVARIDVSVRSLFDGDVREVSEEVPFLVGGSIQIDGDGSARIAVSGGPDS